MTTTSRGVLLNICNKPISNKGKKLKVIVPITRHVLNGLKNYCVHPGLLLSPFAGENHIFGVFTSFSVKEKKGTKSGKENIKRGSTSV